MNLTNFNFISRQPTNLIIIGKSAKEIENETNHDGNDDDDGDDDDDDAL